MKPAAFAAFMAITRQFEGGESINWMFPDVKGLVSTGMGLLLDGGIDPTSLPWRHGIGGDLATTGEIQNAFQTVKDAGGGPFFDENGAVIDSSRKSGLGGGNAFWQNLTDLRLDADGMAQAVKQKLDQNESILRATFPGYDAWPAEAQVGLNSLAWARGAAFPGSGKAAYPHFTTALKSMPPDFVAAAVESHLDETGNAGVGPRNDAQFVLFHNADQVMTDNSDPDVVSYPNDLKGIATSRRDLGRGGSGNVPRGGGGGGGGSTRPTVPRGLISTLQQNPGKTALGGLLFAGLVYAGWKAGQG